MGINTGAMTNGTQEFAGRKIWSGEMAAPPAALQDIATGNTILLPANNHAKRLDASAGAATGVILTPGLLDGQIIKLFNISANAITFAAAGTSNVADGVSSVIATLTGMELIWDATAARWFHLK